MKYLPLLLPVALLAACGEEPAPEPVPTETATPEPTPTVPAPDEELFASLHAATCEGAEPVSTSVCRRAMGADTVSCEFGLGEDEYLRHDATLAIDEAGEAWAIVDPETVCAQ
ncbi:hypothetical protein OZN62_04060 [Aurantiacibacter sp. MUD11]|uniref:hypothetical protein n=1 Tax=Aurantiacibacter sp. MUD11 TaxID=3003265 RepID=UPI0022AB33A3|nr:hypothetical protein [Aurantiacibacter sp. MUD11]WAT18751.1 hypothetical protein OZN62_04060 [Aurantiacibacter sp. MUD11]